jgi:EAL and modified HD-GYP domain-containing signal transduction protein
MQTENFIVRNPLLNNQERVLGYALSWQDRTAADPLALADLVRAQLDQDEPGALLGEHLLFLDATPDSLSDPGLAGLPAKGMVFALRGADLADGDALAALRAARGRGYGIALRDADAATLDKNLLAQLTHVELAASAPDLAARVEWLRAQNLPGLHPVAHEVADWQSYDRCVALGLNAFVDNLPLTARPDTRARELNPAQAMILQLMDMVRKNVDVRQLESVLKRDAALAYKLLRYINSAGFGLGCEIQSLKHAVTMLGYSPLYRWLALLLATATTTGYSPVLMQTAVIRGRFAELLGHGLLPRQEAENLFVTGMFSLLDKLLGVPMEDVLEKIQLSEPVAQALLTREGIYGPFLALAEACELHPENVDAMATSLCIGARQVNQSHLAALAWAQGLQL